MIDIQNLINDGKAERMLMAEKRRNVDLLRIVNMKSKEGINPLQLFPKEIWCHIFKYLDAEELDNVWRVHPLFRNLLANDRVDILMSIVLRKVARFQYCIKSKTSQTCFDFNHTLRRISKRCRQSYDLWMEESLIRRMREMEAPERIDSIHEVITLHVQHSGDRKKLKGLLTSFGGNSTENKVPFFFPQGLAVSLTEDDDFGMIEGYRTRTIVGQFKSDISTLLKTIGCQINHFRFIVDNESTNFPVTESNVEVYILLHQWLSCLPNLKWLEISIRLPLETVDREKKALLFENHPFPHLIYLERLGLHFSNRINEEDEESNFIYEVVLKANKHVDKLDVDPRYWYTYKVVSVPSELPSSLTGFTARDEICYGDDDTYLSKLFDIQYMMNFNWPLQTVVFIGVKWSPVYKSIMALFSVLEKFPTVENVKLEKLNGFRIGGLEKVNYLQLPNLTDFKMTLANPKIETFDSSVSFFFSLHFLVRCRKLKKLSWNMTSFDDIRLKRHLKEYEMRHFGKVVDFRSGMRFVYDSNIWHVFPSLECIQVVLNKNCVYIYNDAYLSMPEEYCYQTYLRSNLGGGQSARVLLNGHSCIKYDNLEICEMLSN